MDTLYHSDIPPGLFSISRKDLFKDYFSLPADFRLLISRLTRQPKKRRVRPLDETIA